MDITKDKAHNVTISSIPPLLDLTDSENKVATVNAGLLQLFEESKIAFADNIGSINQSLDLLVCNMARTLL